MSVMILVGIYVIVATAAIAFGGSNASQATSGDVLGVLAGDVFGSSMLGKIVIVAVLTSAAASTQTTILPTFWYGDVDGTREGGAGGARGHRPALSDTGTSRRGSWAGSRSPGTWA